MKIVTAFNPLELTMSKDYSRHPQVEWLMPAERYYSTNPCPCVITNITPKRIYVIDLVTNQESFYDINTGYSSGFTNGIIDAEKAVEDWNEFQESSKNQNKNLFKLEKIYENFSNPRNE